MLRLFGLLLTLVVFSGAVLAIDFNSSRREAEANGQPVPDFETYLSVLKPRLMAKLSPTRPKDVEPEISTDLAQMLPRPPKGWTVRSAEGDDLAALFPKNKNKLDAEVAKYIDEIARSKGPKGGSSVALTYERGDEKVIAKARRHPDRLFSDPVALRALLAEPPPFFQRAFLRVRGLDVLESNLPAEMRARLFTADLGAQIRIWILAPERMSEQDLLSFFETLDVRSLNASVLAKEAGLGELSVLMLASKLDEEGLSAYKADLAEAATERDARWAETLSQLENTGQSDTADEALTGPANVTCTDDSGGAKRCQIDG